MQTIPPKPELPGHRMPLVNKSYLNTPGAVEVYEHAIYVAPRPRLSSSIPPEPPKRGAVNTFSRASRRRLIKTFMKLESSRLHAPYFVTLTFHHWDETTRRPAHEYLNTFLTDLRRTYPDSFYLWRLELQKRGAPHYHLIIWQPAGLIDFDEDGLKSWINATWHRIADPESEAHAKHGVRVDRATSFRKAFSYVTKYTAKYGGDNDEGYPGRRWARSRSLPVDSICGFEITDASAHYLKRILRKMINKRAGKKTMLAEYMKRPQSCLIRLDAEEAYRLLDAVARSGPILTPGLDPFEDPGQWCAMLERRRQAQAVRFRAYSQIERGQTHRSRPGASVGQQGVPS